MAMVKPLLKYISILAVGIALGYYFMPTKVTTVTKEVIKRDIKIVERKVTRPDGTVEETKETVDKSKESNDSTTITDTRSLNLLQVSVSTDFGVQPIYAVTYSRRFFGPVLLGVSASTDGTIGVVAGLEF